MNWLSRLVALALVLLAVPSLARVTDTISESIDSVPGLSVSLGSESAFASASDDVRVQVTLSNFGAEPLAVPDWFLPDGELDDPLFVIEVDGRAVDYLGPIVKRGAPTDADFILLMPGESRTGTFELSGSYDLSAGGDYSIRYEAKSTHVMTQAGGRAGKVSSNPVSITIEGRRSANARVDVAQKVAGGGGITYSGRCTASQQSLLSDAVGAATAMSGDALSYLGKTPGAKPRYTTWFGAYSSAGWNTAKSHFTTISDAFNTKPLTLDCSCKKKYYAYVYPTKPYVIYVCSVFWTAPMTGTDSKGGTLVHEMSHFNVTAGTNDWAYGQSAAKSLAISDPAKALDNADNHEYFAENTPTLQ
jgi:peptidyl-Lys metalloendopeptidase